MLDRLTRTPKQGRHRARVSAIQILQHGQNPGSIRGKPPIDPMHAPHANTLGQPPARVKEKAAARL